MHLLIAALASLFLIELAITYWPWRVSGTTIVVFSDVVPAVAFAVAWLRYDQAVNAMAIAGGTMVLREVYRFIRAWADRVEILNMLPLNPRNR